MSREKLVEIARHVIDHGKAGTMEQADDIYRLPASSYYDEALFEKELQGIFHRVPLLLAASGELAGDDAFKTMEVAGKSVLLTRGRDGQARAFMNACTHRGATLVGAECGNRNRFTCRYHGWTYANDGRLLAIAANDDYGDLDRSAYGLKELPLRESAGLIWVVLNADSTIDFDAFLAGYDQMLAAFGFDQWDYVSTRTFAGPNWKIAYDGYLEYYHIPVLHNATFGPDSTKRGLYYGWGPHQHIKAPALQDGYAGTEVLGYLQDIADKPESEWDLETMTYGVWTVFPCTSIASFAGGGRGVMMSQILPGATVGESVTNQVYLMEKAPVGDELVEANRQFDWFQEVVMTEDYAMGYSIQQSLPGSGIDHLPLGRNELGNQRFHQWCAKVVAAQSDEDLNALFRTAAQGVGIPNASAG